MGTNGNPNGGAYLIPAGTAGAVWVSDTTRPPFNERNGSSITVPALGNPPYAVTVTLRRNNLSPHLVEITSQVTGEATATVRQIVRVVALGLSMPTLPSVVVDGCIPSVPGKPKPSISGPILIDNNWILPSLCFDQGHFTVTDAPTFGSFPLPGVTAPPGSQGGAWEMLFGTMSRADMLLLAKAQPSGQTGGPIYYYSNTPGVPSTNAPNDWTAPPSRDTAPVIILFDNPTMDNCPNKVTGGPVTVIYGIVYCRIGLDMEDWGGTTIYGTLATDTNVTKYTANTVLQPLANNGLPTSYPVKPVISKVPGTWRDF